jgi:glutathione S-transferase
MRRLVQLLLSPPSRFVRLMIAEKRLACDLATPEDLFAHLPVFVDLDGTRGEGLWAIVDHLEGNYPEILSCRKMRARGPNRCACSIGRWGRSRKR